MVPSRVVRGGLLAASTGASSLPLGFMGLLLHVIVSVGETKQMHIQLQPQHKTSERWNHFL